MRRIHATAAVTGRGAAAAAAERTELYRRLLEVTRASLRQAETVQHLLTAGVGDTIEPAAETSGSADEKHAVVVSVYGLNDRQTMPRRDSGDATPRRTEDKFVPVSQDRCPDSSNRRHKPFLGPGDFPFLDRQRDDQERRQEPGDGTHIQRPHTVFWHTSSSKLTK